MLDRVLNKIGKPGVTVSCDLTAEARNLARPRRPSVRPSSTPTRTCSLPAIAVDLLRAQARRRERFFGGRELRSASSMTELSLEQQLCIPARQRAQLSPPPASSFDSKRSHRPVVTGPDSAQRDL
jgi:hypothetical protein